MKLKYETMKKRIKLHIAHQFEHNGFDLSNHAIRLFLDSKPMSYYNTKQSAKIACFDVVDNWDIRAVSSLLKIFPDVYPKMVNRPLSLAYNDNMEWTVETT